MVDSLVRMAEHNEDRLQVYANDFERPLLAATRQYYQRECAAYLADNDCANYMTLATGRLQEEELRGQKVLHTTSQPKLTAVCEEKLVHEHRVVMHRECQMFLSNDREEDLLRMYRLLRRVAEGIDPVLAILESFICAKGTQRLAALQAKDGGLTPTSYVDCISALHQEFAALVKGAFDADTRFVEALDKACRTVINGKNGALSTSPTELLAKFTDSCLRKSSKAGSESEVEAKLVRAVFVFRYVDDKDMFQKMYSKALAKRLIHGSSISDEAEENMISMLKQRCGYEYTAKLQRMFTDITLSAGLNAKFQQTEVGAAVKFGLKVLVLQSGAWPVGGSTSSFAIPTEMEGCVKHFDMFYDTCHSGRKLNWLHHLATGDMKARLDKGMYEFSMTTYQMAVALLFNTADAYTVGQIRELTSLSEKELQRTLRSLVACKLLRREKKAAADGKAGANMRAQSAPESGAAEPAPGPPSPRRSSTGGSSGLDDSTVLMLNVAYSNKKKKVKISSAVQRETPHEAKQLRDSVNEDRKFFLQAVIVRVMKMRKLLGYAMLVKEVIDQSAARFKPAVSQIKRCIEELIEKQYLERSESDKQQLSYLA